MFQTQTVDAQNYPALRRYIPFRLMGLVSNYILLKLCRLLMTLQRYSSLLAAQTMTFAMNMIVSAIGKLNCSLFEPLSAA